MLKLLLRLGWLDYDNLCVFGKSLFQPEYRIPKTAFEENLPKECILSLFDMRDEIRDNKIPPSLVVQEWARSIKNKSNIKCNFFETASDVPDPCKLNSEDKNLMIVDDLLLERQISANVTIFVEDIVMWIAFTFRKTISNYLDNLSEKTLNLFAFSPKTLIISIMIM